jgi:hypothetical protein
MKKSKKNKQYYLKKCRYSIRVRPRPPPPPGAPAPATLSPLHLQIIMNIIKNQSNALNKLKRHNKNNKYNKEDISKYIKTINNDMDETNKMLLHVQKNQKYILNEIKQL